MADKPVYVKEGRWSAERKDQAEGGMEWGGLPATAEVGRLPTAPLSSAGSDPQRSTGGGGMAQRPPHARDILYESIFSSPPETLLPIPVGVEGEAWALPTQGAPTPGVERLWPQRAPDQGQWELGLSKERQYGLRTRP